MNGDTIYIYVDESGDFEFSSKGSDHFLLAAYLTTTPTHSAMKALDLKYELMQHDMERPYFHATEDSKGVRRRVMGMIGGLGAGQFHVIWADKHLASPKIHSQSRFYELFASALTKFLCAALVPQIVSIVLIYDNAIPKKQQKEFLKKIKPAIKAQGRQVRIHFDSIKHDPNGQIADYAAWAYFRKKESGDMEHWKTIEENFKVGEFDIFRRSNGNRYW
ncbi:hypothetical protein CXR25_14090 [Brevibacterium aurantiacum]|uniref:DUF3800 domain-containing protein n=1 Tax=Brevibacterium aurantiacum TaxID=273384 RepID=UPI000F64D498|nr:DUF3800 domain-containing protein [Brevibacterium aurantiacum]AZL13826.1 hypothetical protein CXR25_14090 [Brevibacterium aurantiacum]